MITDLVGAEITRGTIGTLRDDIAELSAQLDDAELRAEALPHRRENLLLVVRFLRRLLDLHLELVQEVENELAPAAPAEQEAALTRRSRPGGRGSGSQAGTARVAW